MLLAVALYIGIITFMNAYIFFFISNRFGSFEPLPVFVGSFLVATSFIAATLYERKSADWFGKLFYIVTATWVGASFILFFLTLIVHFLSIFIEVNRNIVMGLLGLWLVIVVASIINAAHVRLERTQVTLKGIRKAFTAVCISDLHLGAVRNAGFAGKIVGKIQKVNPDVVFIVGDLGDDTGNFTKDTVKPFDKVKVPIFYVTGNHENYLGLERLLPVIRSTKFRMLRDEAVMFKGVQLIGFDYPLEGTGIKLEDKLKKIRLKKNVPKVLLYHAPTEFAAAQKKGINVMISGHVHGGQIIPFNFLVGLAYEYNRGYHDYKDMRIIISQGAGTWGPPMRFGSRSEMIAIKFMPSQKV